MLKSFLLAAAFAGVIPAAAAQTAFTVNGQLVSIEEQKQLMDFLKANSVPMKSNSKRPHEAFSLNKKSSSKQQEKKASWRALEFAF